MRSNQLSNQTNVQATPQTNRASTKLTKTKGYREGKKKGTQELHASAESEFRAWPLAHRTAKGETRRAGRRKGAATERAKGGRHV